MKNQLLKGDALSVLPTLEAGSFDALITDPPYASGGLTASARQKAPSQKYCGEGLHADFAGDERDQRSHLRWMTMWLAECSRLLKDGAPVCLFTDWRQLPLTTDALQCAGFTWRGITVWDKTEGVRPQLGRFRFEPPHQKLFGRMSICDQRSQVSLTVPHPGTNPGQPPTLFHDTAPTEV